MFIIGSVFFLEQEKERGSQKNVRWVREGVRLTEGVRWWEFEDGGVRMCEMRLLSRNVLGLGGFEKRKEVKELVREKYPFVLRPLNYDYSFRPSVGLSGGLLTVWDTSEVEVSASSRGDHFLLFMAGL
jgi:hypothetical protein